MPAIRSIAKSCVVLLLGRETRPRKILRGLASGYRISVSPVDNLGYLVGTAEPHLQQVIRKFVAPGDTVYDIGANIGYVTLSLAKQVGATGRVIAFEPVPRNFDLLQANLERNRLPNVRAFALAASDRRGEAVIRIADNLSTASLIWHKNDPSAIEIVINTVLVDDLVDAGDLPHPSFIKIDVEGAEGLVLLGMRRTLAAATPVVFLECSESGRQATWQLLSELGYRCHTAIAGKPVTEFEQYRHADFLWLPASHTRRRP